MKFRKLTKKDLAAVRGGRMEGPTGPTGGAGYSCGGANTCGCGSPYRCYGAGQGGDCTGTCKTSEVEEVA